MVLNLSNHKDEKHIKNIATVMSVKSHDIDDNIVLKTEHLTKIFDSKGASVVALQDINCTVKRGECSELPLITRYLQHFLAFGINIA